jgi:hypothetical protein
LKHYAEHTLVKMCVIIDTKINLRGIVENFKKQITFTSTSWDGENISLSSECNSDITWVDVSEMFLRFLLAMGYNLKHEDVVEHLAEMLPIYKD